MKPNLAELRTLLEPALNGRVCFTKDNQLNPFLNPPYEGVQPGVMSDVLFNFHELYPEIFNGKTRFMGSLPYDWRTLDQRIWAEEFDLISLRNGYFDQDGQFHAPLAVYRAKMKPTSALKNRLYILFQQGNYRIVPEESREHIENDKLLVHRGIGRNTEFTMPHIGEERWAMYQEYLAYSFASPLFSLSYNAVSRAESSHVNEYNRKCEPLIKLYQYRSYFQDLEQSFSSSGDVAERKFGPNWASFEVPLDNVRILTQWTGEEEVFILDPQRVKRLK